MYAMKIICILFHVGKNKNEISQDLKLRLLAGAELVKENSEATVLLIGGNGLEISGAEMMKNFWVKNFPKIKNDFFVLNSSNNTFDNLREVKNFLKENKIHFLGINIISSAYHVKRLQKIINNINLQAEVLSAEGILISKNIQTEEIKKYLNSTIYKRKIFLENIFQFYLFLDSKQKMIRIWRRFSYGK